MSLSRWFIFFAQHRSSNFNSIPTLFHSIRCMKNTKEHVLATSIRSESPSQGIHRGVLMRGARVGIQDSTRDSTRCVSFMRCLNDCSTFWPSLPHFALLCFTLLFAFLHFTSLHFTSLHFTSVRSSSYDKTQQQRESNRRRKKNKKLQQLLKEHDDNNNNNHDATTEAGESSSKKGIISALQ